MRVLGPLAIALASAWAMPAAAAIVISAGPSVPPPEEALLFSNNPTPAFMIEGVTDLSGTFVSFFGGETLQPQASVLPRLDTADTRISSAFTFRGFANQQIGVDLSDLGLAFTSTQFRLQGGTATQATLTFVDTAGLVFQETFALTGTSTFSATAVGGQQIDYFSIATNGSLDDVRQIRVGGVGPLAVIPEPSAWALMIAGFGGVGAAMRRRRSFAPA